MALNEWSNLYIRQILQFTVLFVCLFFPVRTFFGQTWYAIRYITTCSDSLMIMVLYSHAAASRSRLSESDPTWFVFETSCYAFGGRIHRFVKVKANKVNMFYCIVLIVGSCIFRCTLSIHRQYVYLHCVIGWPTVCVYYSHISTTNLAACVCPQNFTNFCPYAFISCPNVPKILFA